jgi:MFS family permease
MADDPGSSYQPHFRDSGRLESEEERADRNLSDLLQELRVALPGVQVLFAFLLTVPFTNRFDDLTGFQEKLYFGVLIAVALATVLLVAPTIGHRILFRRQQKEYIVTISNNLALIGMFLLAVSMCGAIALISDFLFGAATAIVSTIVMAAAFVGFWFAGPIIRRAKLPPRTSPPESRRPRD